MMLKTGQYSLMVALCTCYRNNVKNNNNATVKGILLKYGRKVLLKCITATQYHLSSSMVLCHEYSNWP